MSLVIPIFVRGVEEGGGFMEFPEVGGGGSEKERVSRFQISRRWHLCITPEEFHNV